MTVVCVISVNWARGCNNADEVVLKKGLSVSRLVLCVVKGHVKSDTQKAESNTNARFRKKRVNPRASKQPELSSCSNQPHYLLTDNIITGQCRVQNKSVQKSFMVRALTSQL